MKNTIASKAGMPPIFFLPTYLLVRSWLAIVGLLLVQTTIAQQQTKKGRWFIMHSVGGFEHRTEKNKQFNGAGVLQSEDKLTNFGFKSAFTGPNYGNLIVDNLNYVTPMDEVDINRFAILLTPTAGIFLNDNFLLGASLLINYDHSRREDNDSRNKNNTVGLGLGPLVRYYFGGMEKARFFTGLESRYSFSNTTDKTNGVTGANTYQQEYDFDTKTLIATPHAGYAWFAGKRWSFELHLDYRYEKTRRTTTVTYLVNGVLQTGYPQVTKTEMTVNRISLNAGVGFSI
jgi:hypothetical protein